MRKYHESSNVGNSWEHFLERQHYFSLLLQLPSAFADSVFRPLRKLEKRLLSLLQPAEEARMLMQRKEMPCWDMTLKINVGGGARDAYRQ